MDVPMFPACAEAEDDARLIAAAPDLLAVCEDVLKAMAIPRVSVGYAWIELILPRLEAAVSKAKGDGRSFP